MAEKKIKISELPPAASIDGLITLGVDAQNKSVKVPFNKIFKSSIYKYNLKKIFALSSSSESEDIVEAFTPTYAPDGNTAMRLPQSGDLLEATNGATSVVLKGLSKSFSFFYGDKRRDITLSGSAGNYKVAVVVTPLDVRVFDLDKLNALTDESSSEDIEDALVDGYAPVPGNLLQGADGYAAVLSSDYNSSTGTTSFSYITGGKRRTITVDSSGGQGYTTVTVEETPIRSGVVRLSVRIDAASGTDLGYSYEELVAMVDGGNTLFIDKDNTLFSARHLTVGGDAISFLRIGTLTQYNGSYYWGEPNNTYNVTDAGGGKVNISTTSLYKVPYLDSSDKIPAALLPSDIGAPTVYDLTKIDALTGSSSSTDVQAAFTVDGKQSVPQVGDILRSNSTDYPYNEIVVYAQSTDNGEGIKSFKYLSGTTIRAIQVMPDFSAVNVTETRYEPKKYDYDKVMALSNESTELDINEAFTPIGGSEPSTPTPGDLLVSTDDRNNAIILARQQTTASNAAINIRYIYDNILRNISVRFNPRFSISVADIELDKEVETNGALRITTSKISVLVSGGTASCDLGVTYQQLQDAIADNQLIMGDINGELYAAVDGNSNVTLMSVAFLSGKWHSVIIAIPSYSGTTASVTVTMKPLMDFVTIPYSFLSGEIGGVFDRVKMPDLLSANIIITDKGIATLDVTSGYVLSLLVDGKDYVRCTIDFSDNGGLKLTARTVIPNTGIFALPIGARDMADEAKAVDIGIPLDDLADLIENGVIRAVSATDGSILTASASTVSSARRVVLKLVTTTPFISNGNVFIESGIGFHLTDAGSGKVDITKIADLAKAPCVDKTGKLPAEVLPEQEPHVEFSLQLHNGDLLMICKEGEILPTDEIRFYRRGRYCTRTRDKVSEVYVGFNKKDGWRTNGQNTYDGNYETYIPMTFGKEKLEQGVDGNPKLVGMDVWKLTAIENQSGFADPFPALFRSAMVRLRYPNEKDSWDVYIRDGRDGKKYGWEDFQKLSQTGEIRKTVQAGVAVHRNWKRISGIVPFKIRFHLINDGTLSEEVPPTIDDNYVRVTLRI